MTVSAKVSTARVYIDESLTNFRYSIGYVLMQSFDSRFLLVNYALVFFCVI